MTNADTVLETKTSAMGDSFPVEVVLNSDANTTVVDPSFLDSSEKTSIVVKADKSEQINYKDLKRIIEMDDDIQEVTIEQIKRVKMMHDKVMEGAVSNFNYNTLLFVASVLAGLGLVSDSSATIIASMLVSPLMGPVVAMAYGTTICDRRLTRIAFLNEVLSLLFCVLIGVIIGAITGMTDLAEDWPTKEIATRATLQNLYVGIPIAFFSGLGVAVSMLDDQTNSLVGVAISASLLPPAVNCGILWVMYGYYEAGHIEGFGDLDPTGYDFSRFGWISLGLTLINIFLIWLSSMLMFRLKEVLPIEKKVFWSDLGIARKIYRGKALLLQDPPPPPPLAKGSPMGNTVSSIESDWVESS